MSMKRPVRRRPESSPAGGERSTPKTPVTASSQSTRPGRAKVSGGEGASGAAKKPIAAPGTPRDGANSSRSSSRTTSSRTPGLLPVDSKKRAAIGSKKQRDPNRPTLSQQLRIVETVTSPTTTGGEAPEPGPRRNLPPVAARRAAGRRRTTGPGSGPRRNLPGGRVPTADPNAIVTVHADGSRTVRLGMGRFGFTVALNKVLVALILLFLAGTFLGSPIHTWMVQGQEAAQQASKLEAAQKENAALRAELSRWEDPEYVSAQARSRLGYLKPGETRYVVIDPPAGYTDPAEKERQATAQGPALPWFLAIAESTQTAATTDAGTQAPAAKTSAPQTPAVQKPSSPHPSSGNNTPANSPRNGNTSPSASPTSTGTPRG